MHDGKGGLILIAEDDPDTRLWVEMHLRVEGYEVATAPDGAIALDEAMSLRPDLVLLDVMMPSMSGLDVCRELRSDTRTKYTPVILVTGKGLSSDRLAGLRAGADDYVVKPFDPDELVARVELTIKRVRQMRAVNPLTQLPGNVDIEEELDHRLAGKEPFALLYVDIDNFKAFNDYYGFMKGDEALLLASRCITEAVRRRDGRNGFVGHVGGDDFVAIVSGKKAEFVARDIISAWDSKVVDLYDDEARQRGYIAVPDRRNEMRNFPLCTVSIGIATNLRRPINTRWHAAEIAKEMKLRAKLEPRSHYSMDRRESVAPPPLAAR